MTLYANNVSASGCLSWTIAPGIYDVTADFNNLKLTVKRAIPASAVEGITSDVAVSPVYYTLQGIKVTNPTNGLYIVVRGSKVTKEYVK